MGQQLCGQSCVTVASDPTNCGMWPVVELTGRVDVSGGAGEGDAPGGCNAFAASAGRVHLRTAGQANTRSFTTVAGSTPIVNLRLAQMLNVDPFSINDYQGPITGEMPSVLTKTCPVEARYWPHVYQACGNMSGLHWSVDSDWQLSGPSENLELWVR
ncbi:MAG: hypothetical protein JNK82_28725 [Myxococcaceae bacterium]|nr:hypothetical protein [Myxococcaceae bacterium]